MKYPAYRADCFLHGFGQELQRLAEECHRNRLRQISDIMRGWFQELLGPDCPKNDADLATVALAKGYVGRIARDGFDGIEMLTLRQNGKEVRRIELVASYLSEPSR